MSDRIFSIDIQITTKAYIQADSAIEALAIARSLAGQNLTFPEARQPNGIMMSEYAVYLQSYPDLSLSPNMSITGPAADSLPKREDPYLQR